MKVRPLAQNRFVPPAHGITAVAAALFMMATGLAVEDTLAPAWTFATEGPVFSSPAAGGDTIYIGSDDRHLYALDARTGALHWKRALPHAVRSQPLIDDTTVYLVSGNDAVALARADGAERWTHTAGDERGAAPSDRWDYHQSSLVRDGDRLYYGGGNGVLYALDRKTGARDLAISSDGNAAIRTTPAVSGNRIIFGDWNGIIYAADAGTGAVAWKRPTCPEPRPYPQFGGAVSRMLLVDGLLYFGLRNPDILCLDAGTGEVTWKFTAANGTWVAGSPVVAGDTMFITGSDDHLVHARGARDGAGRWTCDLGGNMFVAPLVVGNRIIIGDANSYAEDAGRGRLHVVDRATGTLVRSVAVGGNLGASSPALAGGRVIVGSEDGQVYAYDLAELLN